MRSIKEECLDRLIPLGERHLRRALVEFVTSVVKKSAATSAS